MRWKFPFPKMRLAGWDAPQRKEPLIKIVFTISRTKYLPFHFLYTLHLYKHRLLYNVRLCVVTYPENTYSHIYIKRWYAIIDTDIFTIYIVWFLYKVYDLLSYIFYVYDDCWMRNSIQYCVIPIVCQKSIEGCFIALIDKRQKHKHILRVTV